MELAVTERIASEFVGRIPLPINPHLLERLIRTLHNPTVSPADLSRLIEMDPVLCCKALHVDRGMTPNDPPAEPFSIQTVIKRIGLSGVNAIVCRALVDQALDGIHHRRAVALTWLWRHSLTTALIARELARAKDAGSPDEAYLSGLWHMLGNLALAGRTPEACLSMLSDPLQALPLLEAEARVVGGENHLIAAAIIDGQTHAWRVADTVRSHHLTEERVIHAFLPTQILWAATRLAAAPHPSQDTYRTVAALLELDMGRLARLVRDCTRQVGKAANGSDDAPMPPGTGVADQASLLNREIRIRTALSHVNARLLAAPDKPAVMDELYRSLGIFMGIEAMIVMEHEPRSDSLSGIFAAGCAVPLSPSSLHIHPTASQCLAMRCRLSGETMDSFTGSQPSSLTMIDRQLIRYTGADGIVCAPMNPGQNGSWACIVLGIHLTHWPWFSRHADLLQAIVAAGVDALQSQARQADRDTRRVSVSEPPAADRMRRIVHEINNPLSIIKNYLGALTASSGMGHSERDTLAIIDGEINRVTELVRSLTRAPETPSTRCESLDLNATIRETLVLFGSLADHTPRVHIDQDLDERIPPLVLDGDRLKQALINLLKNAMEAMPDGGSIRVRTRLLNTVAAAQDSSVFGNTVQISVCDDGPGIDDSVKNDLFKSHVTSKSGHDGLGLPIVMEIITHLNGVLRIENVPGRGACFHIELPAGQAQS